MTHRYTAGLLALLMSTALAAACNTGPDPEAQVSEELKAANIEDVNVDYDRSNRVLHLKGEVDTPTDSQRAEQIATRAIGTSGRVANELTVAGMNDRTADDMDGAIRRELNAKVSNDMTLQNRSINFDVNNGVVTIKGDVQSEAERQKVGELARGTSNVRDIVNALNIDASVGRDSTTVPPATPVR